MKFLKKQKRSGPADGLPDVETLLSTALMEREVRLAPPTPIASADGPPADGVKSPEIANDRLLPTDEHRALAQSMLYDFAMRHFSSQVEAIRRDAVIDHLVGQGRDRMRFGRLFFIAVLGTLVGTGLVSAALHAATRYGVTSEHLIEGASQMIAAARSRFGF